MIKKSLQYIAILLFFSIAIFSIHLLKEFLSIPDIDESSRNLLLSSSFPNSSDKEFNKTPPMASAFVHIGATSLQRYQQCFQEGNNAFVEEGKSCKSSLGLIIHCKNGLVKVGHTLEGKRLKISNIVFRCYKRLE